MWNDEGSLIPWVKLNNLYNLTFRFVKICFTYLRFVSPCPQFAPNLLILSMQQHIILNITMDFAKNHWKNPAGVCILDADLEKFFSLSLAALLKHKQWSASIAFNDLLYTLLLSTSHDTTGASIIFSWARTALNVFTFSNSLIYRLT